MEWKADSSELFAYDLEHVISLTRTSPAMLGVVVTFDARKNDVLRAARVREGEVDLHWLEIR